MEVSSEILDQPPPSDVEAERCLIGALMIDPSQRGRIRGTVSGEDFWHRGCALFFEAIMEMEALDKTLLLDAMRVRGTLEMAGGAAELADCVQTCGLASHAPYYAGIVSEKARKRRMIDLLLSVLQTLYSGRWTAEELRDRLIQRLQEL